MANKRNRKKQQNSLQERLSTASDRWRREAEGASDSESEHLWRRRATSTEAALEIIAWLGSREPGR